MKNRNLLGVDLGDFTYKAADKTKKASRTKKKANAKKQNANKGNPNKYGAGEIGQGSSNKQIKNDDEMSIDNSAEENAQGQGSEDSENDSSQDQDENNGQPISLEKQSRHQKIYRAITQKNVKLIAQQQKAYRHLTRFLFIKFAFKTEELHEMFKEFHMRFFHNYCIG